MDKLKIGFAGLGSIGKRHLLNLIKVLDERNKKYEIIAIRNSKNELPLEYSKYINTELSYNEAENVNFDILFITNPTQEHFVTLERYYKNSEYIFLEKPAFLKSISDVEINKFNTKNIYVACPLRYKSVIKKLKSMISDYNVFSSRIICSSYLPDWRPDTDYRKIYSAKKESGGVNIDLIHEWDYMRYIFGEPKKSYTVSKKISNLEIESNDFSTSIVEFDTMICQIQLDYFGKKSIRNIELFTEDFTITGDLLNNSITLEKNGVEPKIIKFNEDRNTMQIEEIEYFMNIVDGKSENLNDLKFANNTLKIALGEM